MEPVRGEHTCMCRVEENAERERDRKRWGRGGEDGRGGERERWGEGVGQRGEGRTEKGEEAERGGGGEEEGAALSSCAFQRGPGGPGGFTAKAISGSIIQNSARCRAVWLFSARNVGPKV